MKTTLISRWLTLTTLIMLSAFGASAQVTANFAASVTSGCAQLRVEFANMSTGPVNDFLWQFGDGTQSGAENPIHYYTSPGVYTVSLKVFGAGTFHIETKTNYITVSGFGVTVQVADASCGLSNGSIDVTVTGTTPPVNYSWNNGATTQDLSNLAAGSYRVTITDGSACQFSETYLVKNGTLTLTAVKTNVTTPGGSNGAIDLTVTGGTGPYTYSWNSGVYHTEDLTGLSAGTYCVLVTDANGCIEDGCFIIEQPNPCSNFHVTVQVTDANCGSHNGSVNLTVSGGSTPYSFAWSNGATTEDISGLANGSYRVTVEDNSSCRYTETYIIHLTGTITITGTVQHVLPGVHGGEISLTVTGGTSPYSFSWSNGVTTHSISGLSIGTYCVTVTDAGGCSRDKCFLIETIQGTGCSTLTIGGVVHNATSSVATNGFIESFVTGGTPPYSYLWSNGDTTKKTDGLTIGTYCVTVTDHNGCVKDKCFTVGVTQTGCNTLVITGSVSHVSGPGLTDGTIELNVNGGTSPYTYSWSNGATTRILHGLAIGTYCVTVTDHNGCTKDKCIVMEVANGGCNGFSVTAQVTNATCGAANGSVNLTVTGGTSPYTYTWTNGSHDEDRYHLVAGNYRVTVLDANGCSFTETYPVTNSNNNLSISKVVTHVSAAGAMDGAINITVTGGTAPYTYFWTHGATTEDLTNLEVGTYCVLVTDANGCIEDGCFNVEGPGCTNFNITGTVTNAGCGGSLGAINITVAGGTAPYFYHWSNGATTEDLTGLSTGSYTVTVEDNGTCRKVKTFSVSHNGGFQITGIAIPTTPGAAIGSITLDLNGGTGPFTYLWSNGATTQNISNLAPGQYCVLVTSSNGCIEDKCFTIGVSGGCGDFYVTAHDDIYLCGPGTTWLEANAFFGTHPYSFSWSPAVGLSNAVARITQAQVSTTTTFIVTATDDKGCIATDTVVVYVVNPSGSAGVAFDSITICLGDSVQLAAFGGTSYFWDPGNGLSNRHSATPWASPEESKNYVVTIEDGACISSFTVHVEVNENCVWPGDANHDGIANNQDVLVIGIGNGISGFPRPNATNNWNGQFCPDWFLALASGPNLKNVDCDGNGTINAADTLPIFLNYGLTHARLSGPGDRFVDPELYFLLPTDTALAGQQITVPVFLGTSSLQVSNFYGIAFSVNYDNTIVEEHTMSFSPINSFAGNVNDLLSFDMDLTSTSKMDVALTRLNRISVGGYGQIGVINFTMKDDISGKTLLVKELALSFSDVRAIDNNENDLTLFYEPGSMYVSQEVSGISPANSDTYQIEVYPNPTKDNVNIDFGKFNCKELIVSNLLGQEVLRIANINSQTINLDVKQFQTGNYFVTLKGEAEQVSRRLAILR